MDRWEDAEVSDVREVSEVSEAKLPEAIANVLVAAELVASGIHTEADLEICDSESDHETVRALRSALRVLNTAWPEAE